MATNGLTGMWAKIERAKSRIAHLNDRLRAFRKPGSYRVVVYSDLQTRQLFYQLVYVEPVPIEVLLVVGDILQYLRTALDHLAYQMFLASPGVDRKWLDKIYFPIAEECKPLLFGKIEGMRPAFVEAVQKIEAYKGGNGHQLWVLKKLNNIDKHRLLVMAGSACTQIVHLEVSPTGLNRLIPSPTSPTRKCPLEAGDILFIAAPGSEVNENMYFDIQIAFNESEVVEGKPVLPFLIQLSDFVEDIIGQCVRLL